MASRAGEILRLRAGIHPKTPDTQCFYCGCDVFKRGNITITMIRAGNGHREDDLTADHVFPLQHRSRNRLPDAINKVPCCAACNNYKGQLMPLDWLVIMPSPEGATRLGKRLIDLGCSIDDVSDAMARRIKV